MQILRHSKIAVTMEIYTEVLSAATREALEKLGQWLDSDSYTSLLPFAAAARSKEAGCKITTGR